MNRCQVSRQEYRDHAGVALILVLLVLSALALIGAPFVVSMALHDRASRNFAALTAARIGAEAARNHALAALERTTLPVEWESHRQEIETESRPRLLGRADAPGDRSPRGAQRGGRPVPRGPGAASRQESRERRRGGERTDAVRASLSGPSPADYDAPQELAGAVLETVSLPAEAPEDPNSSGDARVVSFRDPRGLTASAEVVDEQGKINLNTAPPGLIAAVFGVAQLEKPLGPRETTLYLDDASPFRGDADAATIDGAVVVVDPGDHDVEVLVYRRRQANELLDATRGDFLSAPATKDFPAGCFVYDLRGWKLGFHRFWSRTDGGFHPARLTEMRSVEAMREIAHWQVASLFVNFFRGEEISLETLRQAGVRVNDLEGLGLDPLLFDGERTAGKLGQSPEYRKALALLRKLSFSSRVLKRLEEKRGARVVVELAARLAGARRAEVEAVEKDLEKALDAQAARRRGARGEAKALGASLERLAEIYQVAGIETFLPEDVERHRDAFTVSSSIPALWSEPQAILDDVSLAGPKYDAAVPRPGEFNPGTVVCLRPLGGGDPELSFLSAAGGAQTGAVTFAVPPLSALRGFGATIQALQRHPVNANTAPRKVLRALFTAVSGLDARHVVTPAEADRLAGLVIAARPLRGHESWRKILESAAKANTIDTEDIDPLFINAVQPTSYFLRTSTTGLCYASGDVYTIESRGLLHAPSGRTIAEARFREIVDVSPAGRLGLGLSTQRDFADGIYLRDPYLSTNYPEGRHQFLLQVAGIRSHLVLTRPLLLHRAPLAAAGGDRGNVRLLAGETPDVASRFTLQEILHFRDTAEGLELQRGEPYVVPISLGAGGSGAAAGGVAPAGGRTLDLTMVPGGFEFWLRMRSFPTARTAEGFVKLVEGGADPQRNYLALLYDDTAGRILLRIRDSSLPDPLIPETRENGPYLQVEARRQLEIDTWYHLRIVWDGVFGGGAQLFIDGVPAGRDNLSTELTVSIPAGTPLTTISVRDGSRFPREGSVRIGSEVFEYSSKSGNSLVVRHGAMSHFKPLAAPVELPGDTTGTGGGTGNLGPVNLPGLVAQRSDMRAPWNGRGSSPTSHASGELVTQHGYSLEVRRKIRIPAGQGAQGGTVELQVPDGDARYMVWGPCGLATKEPLFAFNFPPEVRDVVHYVDFRALLPPLGGLPGGGGGPRGAGGPGSAALPADAGTIVVPLFRLAGLGLGGGTPGGTPPGGGAAGGPGGPLGALVRYVAVLPNGERNAAEYFQSRGVVAAGGRYWLYEKTPLAADYLEAQKKDPQVGEPQVTGLRIVGPYPPRSGPVEGLTGGDREGGLVAVSVEGIPSLLNQLSVLTTGVPRELYPVTGILEVRGRPTPWEMRSGRPDVLGQPLLSTHPDDSVEWLRFAESFEDLFVGRLRSFSQSNFRGYPERDYRLKRQLDIPAGQPLRLVMELSQGGAGFGDYVTVATGDPNVYERRMRRVFKVLENVDGRFFISLVDTNPAGAELNQSVGRYDQVYFRAMNPRLVKFPSWGLPEIGTGRLTLVGDAAFLAPGSSSGPPPSSANTAAAQAAQKQLLATATLQEEEEFQGVLVDEIRRLVNPNVRYDPTFGPRVRYVVVPLDNGTVRLEGEGTTQAAISGVIAPGRAVTPGNPLDVLVVAVSTERGGPAQFASGTEEGVLRIGGELFYFEDPDAGTGSGAPGGAAAQVAGVGVLGAPEGGVYDPRLEGEDVAGAQSETRELEARSTVWPTVAARNLQGRWDAEGFALLRDNSAVRADFFEVIFYKRLGGGGFSTCLRGQFGTPILGEAGQGSVFNAARRLRLKGRALLGTAPTAHGIGDSVEQVPYVTLLPLVSSMTDVGIAVRKATLFGRQPGYVLLDTGVPGQPWEIVAHLGSQGDDLLLRPRTETGAGCFRAAFGTQPQPINSQMFAYSLPFRHFDRYESEIDSEAVACLQKSLRVPGAYWRAIEWREREDRLARERLCDVVVAVRFDGKPDWSVKPSESPTGLRLLEDSSRRRGREPARFRLDHGADELELRVYFRFRPGAFQRLNDDVYRDDWKESPVLESLSVEYEKDGSVLRHEELPF